MKLPMLAIVPPWSIPRRFWTGLVSRRFMEREWELVWKRGDIRCALFAQRVRN